MSGPSSTPHTFAPVSAAIYERLGVPRRINAAGTLTRLGGSEMAPAVLGQNALLSGAAWEHSVHATEPSELLTIDGADFDGRRFPT